MEFSENLAFQRCSLARTPLRVLKNRVVTRTPQVLALLV